MQRRTASKKSEAREHILRTAEELFYSRGYRAVGVDLLISESDVAKATFYRHFPSKDELLVAVLEGHDQRFRQWLEARVGELAKSPVERPLAVFDALAERFGKRSFRGCAFINSMVELADRAHPAFLCAQKHKTAVIRLLERWLTDANVPNPAQVAQSFQLLVDGAIVTAVREGDSAAASRAKALARLLLDRQSSPRAPVRRIAAARSLLR